MLIRALNDWHFWNLIRGSLKDVECYYDAQQHVCFAHLSHRRGVCLNVYHTLELEPYQNGASHGKTASSLSAATKNLVFREKILCPWLRGFTLNEGVKDGYPLEKKRFLLLLTCLVWKQLQISTYMLLIITCTGHELFIFINIDDLKWPWTPNRRVFGEFFAILGCSTHFSELQWNGWR